MKNIFNLFGIAAWVLGTFGGFGYAIYSKAYLVAIAVAILGAMAFPTVKKWLPLK